MSELENGKAVRFVWQYKFLSVRDESTPPRKLIRWCKTVRDGKHNWSLFSLQLYSLLHGCEVYVCQKLTDKYSTQGQDLVNIVNLHLGLISWLISSWVVFQKNYEHRKQVHPRFHKSNIHFGKVWIWLHFLHHIARSSPMMTDW